MAMFTRLFGCAALIPVLCCGASVDFNWDVRPILSENCFRCHGPDANSRRAGLRLDQKEAAYAQAITLGKPEQSEWIRQGAEYKPHWAFIAPVKTNTPQTIDRLVRARFVKEGLKPSPEADK